MEKEILKKIISEGVDNPKNLERAKRSIMSDRKNKAPSNISLLQFYHKMGPKEKALLFKVAGRRFSEKMNRQIKRVLKTRPVRSLSGIVNVSVLTKPYPCPGKCIYCPQEKGSPKSYLKEEPAVMRAIMNKYDPEKQVKTRIEALKLSGHPVDKIDLRIIGGTWSYYPKKYREWFVKRCFDSCNGRDKKTLSASQKTNENSRHRIVGLSVETRPDFINLKEVIILRGFGVTTVELGVQSIYDEVLKKIKRGHGVSETIRATKMLKDAGFKVCYQMMPNLPGSDMEKDKKMFEDLFLGSDFQPDQLKIYPMATIKGTPAYNLWLAKKYRPYSDVRLKKLLKEIKKGIPRYVRIQRLIRDIPAQNIEAGTKISNLRQIILEEMKKEGWSCRCIRCREIKAAYDKKERIKIFRKNYPASGGKEMFLSFEDGKRKKLYSILRLRIPSPDSSPIRDLEGAAIIREVHTYGQQLAIKKRGLSPQHRGLGKKLIKKAEEIVKRESDLKKIAVISAVGTRNYYRKLGFRKKGTYLMKRL